MNEYKEMNSQRNGDKTCEEPVGFILPFGYDPESKSG